MEALKGVRVSGIPDQTSVRHLQQYFSDASLSGGGPVSDIMFPMLANEAVVFFHSQKDATSVLSRNHDVFKVKPLPHQVFSCITAVLDAGMSAVVVSSKEHQRCLREGGLELKMHGEELVVEGNPYEVEFAWAYLHGVMDKQCLIQDHLLAKGNSQSSVTPLDLGQSQVSSTSSSAASTPRRSRPPSGRRRDDSSKNGATALVNGHAESDQQSPRATGSSKSLQRTSNASSKSSSPAPRPTTVESPSPRLSIRQPQPAARDIQQRDVSLSLSPDSPETTPKSLMPSDVLAQPSTSSAVTDMQRPLPTPRTTVADRIATRSSYLIGLEGYEVDPVSMVSDEGSRARHHDAERTFNHFLSMPHQGFSPEEDRATADHVRSRAALPNTASTTGDGLSSLSGPASLKAVGGAEAAGDSRQSSRVSPTRDKLTFEVGCGVKVKVFEGDITKVKTEGVVNAANSELRNWSGVAGALLKAAGPELKRECETFIRRHGYLNTTEVTHTGVGNMVNVIYILHTVGPYFTPGKEEYCLCQLQKTFYNCLTYANSRRLRSISFPYISTGVFGVPLEICVEAFLGGVLLFVMDVEEKNMKLKSMDLVHNDHSVVCQSVALLQRLLEKGQDAMLAQALSRANADTLSPQDYLTGVEAQEPPREREYSSLSGLDRKRSSSFSHRSKKSSSDLDFKSMGATAGSGVRAESHLSDTTPTPSPRTRSSSVDRRRPSSETGARAKTSSSSGSSTAARPSSGLPAGYGSKYMGTATDFSMKGTGLGKKSTTSGAGSSGHRSQPMKAFAGDTETESSHLSKTSYLDKFSSVLIRSSRRADDDDENALMMQSLPADPSKVRMRMFDQCPICLDDLISSKKLQCGHEFCRKCIDKAFKTKPVCPTCNKVFGPLKGDQPRGGRMIDTIDSRTLLPGFEHAPGTIVIRYSFPSGVQEAHHPNPGRSYQGIDRTAYLPNTTEGREVLRLLRKAFDAGLVFTISDSRTTGAEGVITWAEIHHKTRTFGGSTNFGYPDATYLKRVKEELALKGITS